jgi:hypothetical protein
MHQLNRGALLLIKTVRWSGNTEINNRFRLAASASLLGVVMLAACSTSNMTAAATANGISDARHVLLVSIDGLHEQDLALHGGEDLS